MYFVKQFEKDARFKTCVSFKTGYNMQTAQ